MGASECSRGTSRLILAFPLLVVVARAASLLHTKQYQSSSPPVSPDHPTVGRDGYFAGKTDDTSVACACLLLVVWVAR